MFYGINMPYIHRFVNLKKREPLLMTAASTHGDHEIKTLSVPSVSSVANCSDIRACHFILIMP